jgi:hypothetical protein
VFEPPWVKQPFIAPFDAASARFVGTTKYFDKNVNVWQTSQGTIVLPSVTPTPSNPSADPRISATTGLAKFMATDPQFLDKFGGKPVTKADLVKNFGTQSLDNGMSVADAVTILPDTASYANSDALVSDLAERQAGAIRSAGAIDVIHASIGVQGPAGAAASASVANLPGVSSETAAALSKSGIKTVKDLAATNSADVAKALKTGGITTSAGDIASVKAMAITLNQL